MPEPTGPSLPEREDPRITHFRQKLWQALSLPDETHQNTELQVLRSGCTLPASEPIFALARASGAGWLSPELRTFHWPDLLALIQHESPLLACNAAARAGFYLLRLKPSSTRAHLSLQCYRHALHLMARQDALQSVINTQLAAADLLGQYGHRMSLFMASAALQLATEAGLDRSRQVASQFLIMNRYRLYAQPSPALASFQPGFADLGALMHSYRDLSSAMLHDGPLSQRQLDRLFARIMDIQQDLQPSHRRDSSIWYSEQCSRRGQHARAARILFACMEQQRVDDKVTNWMLARQAQRIARGAGWQAWSGARRVLATPDLSRIVRLPARLPLCSTLAQVRKLADMPLAPLDVQALHHALASLNRQSA